LESEEAGKPAKLIRETYLKAGEDMLNGVSLSSVILINDFDTGVGNWGKLVQFTINTQQIFAELMHLTDYPEIVENKPCCRVPIIITGNRLETLHGPLIRTGRMWLFNWHPTAKEKADILHGIFPLLGDEQIKTLVRKYEDQPISFFSQAKSSLLDQAIKEYIHKTGIPNIIPYIRRSASNGIPLLSQKEDLHAITDACENLLKERKALNMG
jgi:hypothetical protein